MPHSNFPLFAVVTVVDALVLSLEVAVDEIELLPVLEIVLLAVDDTVEDPVLSLVSDCVDVAVELPELE